MQAPDLDTAIRKAQIKRDVAQTLAALPPEAQRDVLADLLVTLDEASRVEPDMRDPSPRLRGAPGRPRGAVGQKGRTQTVVETLAAQPRLAIGALAKAVYGAGDDDSKAKVRSILNSLKKQGRVNNPRPGEWEVLAQD